MLEIARTWEAEGYLPNTSVLFAAWDAGEQNHLGAEFYTQYPQYEPEDIVGII